MTLDNFMADIDKEEAAATQEAVRSIKAYDIERANESTAKAAKDAAGHVLRQWLLTHPDETELVDGEWQLKAFMQTRKLPGHKFDLTAIIENHPALFQRLVSERALLVDYDKALASGLDGELKRYAVPSGETQALQVRPIE